MGGHFETEHLPNNTDNLCHSHGSLSEIDKHVQAVMLIHCTSFYTFTYVKGCIIALAKYKFTVDIINGFQNVNFMFLPIFKIRTYFPHSVLHWNKHKFLY